MARMQTASAGHLSLTSMGWLDLLAALGGFAGLASLVRTLSVARRMTVRTDLDALRAIIDEQARRIDGLADENQRLTEEVSALRQANGLLRLDMSRLKLENAELRQEMRVLQTENEELKREQERLKSENAKLRERLRQLE